MGTAEEKAGFAELLRGLKDRSGLSYGTLAKRLHMSASTLHRYCNGDAVPADYAPVERLARLCKATPEELVEVHRRWVVADAARDRDRDRDRRAAAAGTAAGTARAADTARAPGAAQEPGGAEDPDAAQAPGTARASGEAQAPGTAVPGRGEPGAADDRAAARPWAGRPGGAGSAGPAGAPGPAAAEGVFGAEEAFGAAGDAGAAGAAPDTRPAGTTGPAGAGGAGGASGPAGPAGSGRPARPAGPADPRNPAAPTAAVGPPGPADPAASAAAVPPPPRARRVRRRKAVLAASAAALVLASTAALLSLVPEGKWGERRPDSVSAGDSAADGKGAEGRTGTPSSAPPSASSSSGGDASPSAQAGGKRKPEGTDSPSSGGDRARGAGRQQAGGAPLAVTARAHAWEHPCSATYLINRPPEQVPPPPPVQDAPGWVAALGAVAADEHRVELTVQGTGRETVVLQGLRIRVMERAGAPAWNAYRMGVGCGGGVPTKSFGVDLAAGNPVPVPEAGQRDFPYKVSESDPEVLYVTAEAGSQYVSWYAELEWSSGDRRGTLRVDDNGRPFRTTSAEGRPDYGYPLGTDSWSAPLDQ